MAKFRLETESNSWIVDRNNVYDVVVCEVYGENLKDVCIDTHNIACDAETFCEDPWLGIFMEEKFNIETID